MRRFLQETWELWYWAMFCPSRLQQRMNDWSSKAEGNDLHYFILSNSISWRFLAQFFSLITFLSIPLTIGLAHSPVTSDWWLLLMTFATAYGVATCFVPIALQIPLLLGFLYSTTPSAWRDAIQAGWQSLDSHLPPINQIIFGLGTGSLLFGLTIAVVYALLKQQNSAVARFASMFGSFTSITLSSWIITQSLYLTILTALAGGILSYLMRDFLESDDDAVSVVMSVAVTFAIVVSSIVAVGLSLVIASNDGPPRFVALVALIGTWGVAIGVALDVATAVAGGFAGIDAVVIAAIVAGGIATAVAGIDAVVVVVVLTLISQLALLPFMAGAAWLSFSASFSYTQNRWSGFWIGAIFVALGFEKLGWQVVWVLPITCGFYYRWLPDYLVFATLSTIASFNFSLLGRNFSQNSVPQTIQSAKKWLKRLPPFSSELLWLTLPGHARLLAKIFQNNSTLGLSALEKMQLSPLPGLTRTAQNALPDIVSQELLKFENLEQIQSIGLGWNDLGWNNIASNKLLEILLPELFEKTLRPGQVYHPVPKELSILFPRLQKIAENVSAACRSNTGVLRERGLERVLEQLRGLPAQLPGLGLKTQAISRWHPVIDRWQNLLELELETQQKLTKGELLNPFQYGNPLRPSQSDLFKGRQAFADDIVRLLLDRNRPTIILHGPRRCGKTSFLNNLPRLLPSDWVPVFIDMQSAAATADEISFLRNLARSIRRDGRSQGIRILDEPDRSAFQAAPYDIFETWLEKVLEQLGSRQLLLNLDEFEKIGVAIHQGKLSLTLFDELRSLIQHWDQLGFIFCGVQTLEEIGPNWSSYFISVVPVEMLYLEPHEARDLLTNPDPEFALTYVPGLVDDILHLTQCHPNLLQLIGAALVAEANKQYTTTATAVMLEVAIPQAFTLGTSYFTNVWEEFTGDLAQPAEIRAGQRLLKALAEGIQPPANLGPISQAALRRMVRYHVLKQTPGQYQFEIPLIQRWVQERAVLSDEG